MFESFGSIGTKGSTPTTVAALLAAALLLGGVLPAAAAAPGEGDEERHVVEDRRMIVVSADDAEHPRVFVRQLGSGFLGVELTPLTPELRAHFGAPADRGVLVARVEEESPAARAGLQVGDVIAEIDGEAVESPWDLGAAVRGHEAGEEADLVVWRDGRSLDFRVLLEERERAQVDLGRFFERREGEGPRAFRWQGQDGPVDLPMLYVEPKSVERLEEALGKIDWPLLERRELTERNRELEQRLQKLEERLRELEEALRESER